MQNDIITLAIIFVNTAHNIMWRDTVEPLYKGRTGTMKSFMQRCLLFKVKLYYHQIETGVLYREVSFIRSVLYERLHCTCTYVHTHMTYM